MKKSLFEYFLDPWYAVSALITIIIVGFLSVVANNIPQPDATNFLSPITNRLDFLNIADVSLDAIFGMKNTKDADRRIVVVNLGEVGPTPDGDIARLLYKLQNYGVRVVGIDVIFDSLHFERFGPARAGEPLMLKQALRDVPNVVLVNGFSEDTREPAFEIDPEIRASVTKYGFANLLADDDGVMRRFRPWVTVGDERWLSLPVRMVQVYDSTLVRRLLTLPESDQIIYYTGTYDQIQTFPLKDIVDADSAVDRQLADVFKGAIVLVGFIKEGGLSYMGDMHRTPMAKRTLNSLPDGSVEMGVEGPDMPGALIHANVINMLLTGEFVYEVPAWFDWLLVFLLSYLNVALYRVFRGKPTTSGRHEWLVFAFIAIESPIVFFFPIIGFFYFNAKISYQYMAMAVLMFIPADIWSTKIRTFTMKHRFRKAFGSSNVLHDPVKNAMEIEHDALAAISMVHAALFTTHYCLDMESARRIQNGDRVPAGMEVPDVAMFEALVPAARDLLHTNAGKDAGLNYFLRYIFGKKEQLLRVSHMKEEFVTLIRDDINPYTYSEETELLMRSLAVAQKKCFALYLDVGLLAVVPRDDGTLEEFVLHNGTVDYGHKMEEFPAPGVYCVTKDGFTLLSPFFEYAECKLHRENELFIFAGRVPQQFGLERHPVYFGPTISCEPALTAECIEHLRNIFDDTEVVE